VVGKNHCCYIVICSDNTLYCGYSNNVEKRVDAHNKSLGAKYTKTRLPVRLVYTECFDTKSEAMKREYQIKQLTRQQKLKLINEKK
jgi:putative endonuclease